MDSGTNGTIKVDGDWQNAVTQMNAALQNAGSEWRYELTGELPPVPTDMPRADGYVATRLMCRLICNLPELSIRIFNH